MDGPEATTPRCTLVMRFPAVASIGKRIRAIRKIDLVEEETVHMKKKGFIASHSKSSAAVISVGIHALLLIMALSFVAVTVIQKEDMRFEAKR